MTTMNGRDRKLHRFLLVNGLAGLAVIAGLHRPRECLALGGGLGDAGVKPLDIADAEFRHFLVAVLHFADRPFQRDDRLLRVGHDRCQQMRDAVIDRQFQHFRIDHDEAALLRLQPVEQRQDHGVDGNRLARAGRAGDEQMRHACEIDDDRLAADRLAKRDREPVFGFLEILGAEQFAQIDGLAALVRQFDADGVAPLNHGDAGREGRHGAGDIVGETDDSRGFDAGRRLELIERDHRTWPHMNDLALDAEILEHAFEQPGVLAERVLGHHVRRRISRLGENMQRRKKIVLPRQPVENGGLRLLERARSRFQGGRCRRDDAARRIEFNPCFCAGADPARLPRRRGRIGARVETGLLWLGWRPLQRLRGEIERRPLEDAFMPAWRGGPCGRLRLRGGARSGGPRRL